MIYDVKNTLSKQRLEKPSLFSTETGLRENKRDAVSPAACKKHVTEEKSLVVLRVEESFVYFTQRYSELAAWGEKEPKKETKKRKDENQDPNPKNKTQSFLI